MTFTRNLKNKVIELGWIPGSANKGVIRFVTPKLKENITSIKRL